MAGQLEYSATPSSNTTVNGIGIQGSSTIKNGDDALRQLMADAAASITRHVTKTVGSYTALKADFKQLWRATGAVTVNLTAAATLTDGWCLFVKADGGDITVDPNGSEQINGSATALTVGNGSSALILCTGTAFYAISIGDVTLSGTQTLTNKTLTSPAINTPTLTLKQSAAPVPTAEGDIQWGTDDNVLAIGDGAATKLFVPIPASSAAGDIEYFTGAKVKARLAKGTASQVLTMNAGATAPEWATPAFAKPMYESGLSAITSAGTLTLAHGLGGIPTFIFPYFICVTASQGYAVGDIIPMNPARFVIVPDATNLFIRFENTTASYGYYNKTTGAFGNLVAASWNFGVRAGL